ncbi:MAG TPA: PAS domain S-box protein [Fimbriiglobus sp.]
MPLAYVLLDAADRVVDWNPAAEKVFGYRKDEMLEVVPFERLVPPSFHGHTGDVVRRLHAGDMAAHSVNENLTKDGRTITCEWFNTPLTDADGRYVGSLCLAWDVTNKLKLEEQFRRAQLRLAHVIASSPVVLFTLAVEGQALRLAWISDNVRALTGDMAADALHTNWWEDRLHPDDRTRVWAEIRELFVDGSKAHEYRFRHRGETYRWVRAEMRLFRDADNNPVEVVGSWSDVTDRRHLEDQFRQAQKMEAVGRLAGGVAHDFNNLLTIINGYGEVLLTGLPADDPNRDLVREMVTAGERAAGLTRQLLAFSRKTIIESRVLDLTVVVADVQKMLRRIVGEDVQLAVASDPAVDAVKADPGQIEQVLLNLVVNARDAMPKGGRLTIEVRNAELDDTYARSHLDVRPGPYVLLAVTDSGCGMDAATVARIFEPFFSTKGEHGTGLGLATVHGIVRQGGGHVAVYSEVGRGTTFKVYLPRVEKQAPLSSTRLKKTTPAIATG